MRFALPVLALAAALLLVGAIQLTRADSTAAAQHILTFEAVGGSGIAGTATLTAVGNDVQVVVKVTGLVQGNTYISGAYNSTSVNCMGGRIGDFSTNFSDAEGSVTYTAINTTISDIFSTSVRDITQSGSPPGTVVACAERGVAAVAVPDTGGPPPAGDSASAWWYLLIAAGALALLGGGALTLGLRQQR